jgi:hypothetical protein
MLQPGRRRRQHRERRGEPVCLLRLRADEGLGAQRNANRARRAKRLRASDLVGGQSPSVAMVAKLGQRKGRR